MKNGENCATVDGGGVPGPRSLPFAPGPLAHAQREIWGALCLCAREREGEGGPRWRGRGTTQ